MATFSRRSMLGVTGAAGVAVLAGAPTAAADPPAPTSPPTAAAAWAATRVRPYFIGHRGSGDVYPEHTLDAYRGAIELGAPCIEVSVNVTGDGLLICLHDPSYDRTTTLTGTVAARPSTVLRSAYIDAPQLGPAWQSVPRVLVPTFERVLRELGGRAVFAVEAKNDAAYPAMMAMVDAYGLRGDVLAKMDFRSGRLPQAKAAGVPVFSYIGSETDFTAANIATAAARLTSKDCLVIPAYGSQPDGYVSSTLVGAAVKTGIPVWVFGVHRRVDVTHYSALGVQGFVASSYGYVSTAGPTTTADTWSSGTIAPGEMTKSPDSATYAPSWDTTTGTLSLGLRGSQHFLTMGQFGPLAARAGSYAISYQASWTTLPTDLTGNLSLAFGHADDAYYEHRGGKGTGYHVILRGDGRLGLYRHTAGVVEGTLLQEIATTKPTAGQWIPLKVSVTPTTVTATRTDTGATVSAADRTVRGGYFHLGRSTVDGVGAFRALSVG